MNKLIKQSEIDQSETLKVINDKGREITFGHRDVIFPLFNGIQLFVWRGRWLEVDTFGLKLGGSIDKKRAEFIKFLEETKDKVEAYSDWEKEYFKPQTTECTGVFNCPQIKIGY